MAPNPSRCAARCSSVPPPMGWASLGFGAANAGSETIAFVAGAAIVARSRAFACCARLLRRRLQCASTSTARGLLGFDFRAAVLSHSSVNLWLPSGTLTTLSCFPHALGVFQRELGSYHFRKKCAVRSMRRFECADIALDGRPRVSCLGIYFATWLAL